MTLAIQGARGTTQANQTIPLSFTNVPGLGTITVAASAAARKAWVAGQLTTRSVPSSIISIALDGTTIALNSASAPRDANLNATTVIAGPVSIPGDNATHVISLQWAAVGSQGPVDVQSDTYLVVMS